MEHRFAFLPYLKTSGPVQYRGLTLFSSDDLAGLDTGHITRKKAEETIGKEVFWQLPNDYRTMIEARNNGVPLLEQAPRAAITQSILGLGDALTSDGRPQVPEAAKRSGLSRLFGLGKK